MMINTTGANTDPCGTPLVTCPHLERLPLITVIISLSYGKSFVHLGVLSLPQLRVPLSISVSLVTLDQMHF